MIHSKALWSLLVPLCLATCTQPAFQGPQVQSPPPGFRFDPNSTQGRNVFLERLSVRQVAWWRIGTNDTGSSIFITAHRGTTTRSEVQAALDEHQERWGRPGTSDYGGLESLRIDSRTAWGWLETSTRSNGNVRAYNFKAVIPYDSVTYVVDFSTDEENLLLPDSLRAIVHSFAVGRTEIDKGGLALAVLGSLVLLLVIGSKIEEKAERSVGAGSQSATMRLATIPMKEEAQPSAGEADPGSPGKAVQSEEVEAPDTETLPPG